MEPVLAHDGFQALAEFADAMNQGKAFPLVLLDRNMPGMSGYEVVERIRRAVPQGGPAILILSSSPSAADAERASKLGVFRELPKPLRRASLLDAIRQSLGATMHSPAVHPSSVPRFTAPSLSVLLVEDNAVNQKLGIRLLEKMGHQVTLAVNGQEAVDAFRSHQFDLIVMDIQMPVLSGIDATRAIRDLEKTGNRRTPIIAMTAHAMAGDADKFLDAGMDGYVSKPVQIEILAAEIDRLTHAKVNPEVVQMKESNRVSESSKSVNLDELLARVDNDRELLCDLLSIFKQDFPTLLHSLQTAVAGTDVSQASTISHTLKGMLANLAVTKAAAAAAQIERLARAGDVASLPNALAAFEKEVQGVLPEMETYMAEARP
jgi:CheY-like chemotaxis protein/HPt (histidine-containing phosphotransfer) domain-containing protein